MALTTLQQRPEGINVFQGNQVLLNTDRLVFNAKEDSILLFSNKVIGFSTNGSFHFDTDSSKQHNNFIVNCPNIYLGLEVGNTLPTQPAVLGNELKEILERLIEQIDLLVADIEFNVSYQTTIEGEPTGQNPDNKNILQQRHTDLKDLKEDLNSIMSTNTKLV